MLLAIVRVSLDEPDLRHNGAPPIASIGHLKSQSATTDDMGGTVNTVDTSPYGEGRGKKPRLIQSFHRVTLVDMRSFRPVRNGPWEDV
jgi:hypothetical protein